MQNYSLGFVFSEDKKDVLMVSKTKGPQAYKLNGVGGHLEEGEQPIDCMVRECQEETGLYIPPGEWKYRADIEGEDYKVFVYSAFTNAVYMAKAIEKVEVHVSEVKSILEGKYNKGGSDFVQGFMYNGKNDKFNMQYEIMENVQELLPICMVQDLTQVA